MVSRQELAEVIGRQTINITDKQKLAGAVAAYIAGEHRSVDLASLTRDIMQYRLEHGIVEAVAISAHELTPQVIDDIKKLLKEHHPKANTILIDTKIDGSVIGGVRVELAQETLDLTVKSKLNMFKRLVAEERK